MRTDAQTTVELPVTAAFTFGQILVRPIDGAKFQLCHRDDANSDAPEVFHDPGKALEIARTDDSGEFRPLKTAPNLRHGWHLEVEGLSELKRALDLFYPGRLALLRAQSGNRLKTTSLRDTLGRQSGMYRVAETISNDQLEDMIGEFCRSDGGCLRTILWKRDAEETAPSGKLPPEKFDPAHDQVVASGKTLSHSTNIPLLCQEACNLLIAECRRVVKGGLD